MIRQNIIIYPEDTPAQDPSREVRDDSAGEGREKKPARKRPAKKEAEGKT